MIAKLITIVLLVYASFCAAQENAQPRIAPALNRCYANRTTFERDNRLPMNPNMLVELIRKVEDSPGFTLNMRQLATSILFRFKQDGILRKYELNSQKNLCVNKFFQRQSIMCKIIPSKINR